MYGLTYSAYLTPFTTRPEDYEPTGGSLPFVEVARLFKQNTVAALTNMTGGRRFAFETKSKLESDLIKLAADIHGRYLVSFTPDPETTPQFHHLQMKIKSLPDATVLMRPGYWTVRSQDHAY